MEMTVKLAPPPGRWSFGPGVTCDVKHETSTSTHVFLKAVLDGQTSFLQQSCVTLH